MTLSLAAFAAAAAAGVAPATDVDADARTITGLAVPYGRPGQTGRGRLSFRQGRLALPADPSRVKLLREHDQAGEVVGHAVELLDHPAGLFGRFAVDTTPAGDEALRSARAKMRDGLSVGVELDEATEQKLTRAAGRGVVEASGALREVSTVGVPAFDDARVAANASLITFTATHDPNPTEGHDMTPEELAAKAAADEKAAADKKAADEKAAADKKAADEKAAADAAAERPAIVQAAAGMAVTTVTTEPSTYTFGLPGLGTAATSLASDAFKAQMDGDRDAAERMARFNRELVAGNPASVMAVAAIAGTVDAPEAYLPTQYRPDLMVRAIDAGRPLVSRLVRTPITNAQPFTVPVEGEFDGVADHVEKTAVVAPGTQALGGDVVSPKAVSGSYELTRELIDSSNPAIDQIALRGMVKDYRRLSEDKLIAALIAADPAVTVSIDTVMELDGLLEDFVDDDGIGADFVGCSRTLLKALRGNVDADGRPMLSSVNPQNAPGTATARAGSTKYDVGGVPLVRAPRLAIDTGVLVRADGVLFAESATQTFRFEQPKGPGVVILALWGYVGAKALRTADVLRFTKAAV